jgi:transposase InsO family protein
VEGKDEAFSHARDLILWLQNEFPKNAMRAIHSDNGTEFKNTYFETFCASLGLEHQFFSPYAPQQNGVVERKNRTLGEMTRCWYLLTRTEKIRKRTDIVVAFTQMVLNIVSTRKRVSQLRVLT